MFGIISLWFKHPPKINPQSQSVKETSNTNPKMTKKSVLIDFEI